MVCAPVVGSYSALGLIWAALSACFPCLEGQLADKSRRRWPSSFLVPSCHNSYIDRCIHKLVSRRQSTNSLIFMAQCTASSPRGAALARFSKLICWIIHNSRGLEPWLVGVALKPDENTAEPSEPLLLNELLTDSGSSRAFTEKHAAWEHIQCFGVLRAYCASGRTMRCETPQQPVPACGYALKQCKMV